ncbi:hypothetical protein D4R71_06260 [bacterium]|nr:MAG: hypothetical protein D4R71_06260 [bacterium]
MDISFDNLKNFFEKIKELNFWQRIFKWKTIRILSYDAYDEFKKISQKIDGLNQNLGQRDERIVALEKSNEVLKTKVEEIQKLENKITNLESEIIRIGNQKADLEKKVTQFEQTEESKTIDYQKNITAVNAIRKGLEDDRQKLHNDRLKEKEEEFEKRKETWKNHQDNVEITIKNICRNHLIEYVNKVPFKGNPDNTIKIADEYIIFDAKSPANDDLNNFPKYLKTQTESLKKYINQESVKKDIFLVIPTNTYNVIKQFSYNLGDYNVYLVSIDSLEPIILSLKKIEDYEFAEQLTPEERENICRIIGKFAHITKRRIQIDYFFSYQFLEILTKCKADLPKDILKSVIEFEKAEKLNPPQDKRAKQILTNDLIEESNRLAIEARAKLMESKDEE